MLHTATTIFDSRDGSVNKGTGFVLDDKVQVFSLSSLIV